MHDEVSDTENIRKNLAIERTIVEGCDILLDTSQTFIRQGKTFLCQTALKAAGSHCHRQAGHCTGHCQHPEPAPAPCRVSHKIPWKQVILAAAGPQFWAVLFRSHENQQQWVAKPPWDSHSHSAWTVVPGGWSRGRAALFPFLSIDGSFGNSFCWKSVTAGVEFVIKFQKTMLE